ncbi:MAG: arginase family protein [Bacteroidota bacterium]
MLENWLKPLDGQLLKNSSDKSKIGHNLQCFIDRLPNLKKTKVAIIGIGEEEANCVRKHLYEMNFPFSKTQIADLGNLRKEETGFMTQLIRELIEGDICPVIIGHDGRFTQAQFLAHHACQPSVSLIEVKERIAYHPKKSELDGFYLNSILEGEYRLFHFSTIGSQSHFVADSVYRFLEECSFDYVRLGKAKSNLSGLEPFIRDADMMSFHLSALKASDAPATDQASPSGFFSEEACQICRYAGMNDKLTSIGLYGYQSQLDQNELTAKTVAQMVWYFLDGFNNRQKDFPASMDQLVEYIVDLKDFDQQLTFWKSNKTGRWWLQVPVRTKRKLQRHRLIPCSYKDYTETSKGDLPNRLINAFKRFD